MCRLQNVAVTVFLLTNAYSTLGSKSGNSQDIEINGSSVSVQPITIVNNNNYSSTTVGTESPQKLPALPHNKNSFIWLAGLASRSVLVSMYELQMVPTLDNLKLKFTQETNITCRRATLHRALLSMGFKFKAINKKRNIMESQRLRQMRFEYLERIKKFRSENKSIIYLDETWFDTHGTVSKGWVDNSGKCQTKAPNNKGKRITILHAGSENGFVRNCLLMSAKNINSSSLNYHQDTPAELFENWFKNSLLVNIPKNSIIAMDNATYHSRLLNKVPNTTNTKADIQE
ncbi:hypothetical protein NQ315_010517 [Exocentrus adspersus]|uniref:Transposase n=1 Tax=Exocentrus adspersus TaxID=1586481 RepID=A0AAV8W540_9CUCU|nr:hypothetical protein NQ315_010517 [Exocentrus adspersus]